MVFNRSTGMYIVTLTTEEVMMGIGERAALGDLIATRCVFEIGRFVLKRVVVWIENNIGIDRILVLGAEPELPFQHGCPIRQVLLCECARSGVRVVKFQDAIRIESRIVRAYQNKGIECRKRVTGSQSLGIIALGHCRHVAGGQTSEYRKLCRTRECG